MATFFFFLIGFVLYTYLGYPLLLLIKCRINFTKDPTFEPSVSLIITAYNEDALISSKLDNSMSLDYPKDKLEIIVASDGSTDRTEEIAKGKDGIKVLEFERMGKTAVQNEAVKHVDSEIIVFSDANSYYQPSAIRKLIRNFVDPSVGCVCGELQYRGSKSKEQLYWRYEVLLKELESRTGTLLGANGSIYAVRKGCYQPLPSDSMSDFIEPILIFGTGMKVVYEHEAIAVEDEPRRTFSRKRRIILRTLNSLPYMKSLMNPMHPHNLSWSIFSHKVIRWLMPFLLIALFCSNILLMGSPLYNLLFSIQILFYIGSLFSGTIRYFVIVNVASFMAIIDWLRGKKIITWQVER